MIASPSWYSLRHCTQQTVCTIGGLVALEALPPKRGRLAAVDVVRVPVEPGNGWPELERKLLAELGQKPKREAEARGRQLFATLDHRKRSDPRRLALLLEDAHHLDSRVLGQLHAFMERIDEAIGQSSTVVLTGDLCRLIARGHRSARFMMRVKLFVDAEEVCRKAA